MNDFSELENQLKNLRPVRASKELFARVEKAIVDFADEGSAEDKIVRPDRFRLNWLAIGAGLAAAAVILIFARPNFRSPAQTPNVATVSPALRSTAASVQFIPAGATQVVYNTRDEGLLYPRGSEEPVRRMRSRTRETLQWQNPTTGASLRVSYPSEQVELIPVSGQ